MSRSRTEVGSRLVRAAVRAVRGQQDLWEHWLCRPQASGTEARALVGEPPLRWSGGRLRGRVLPDGAERSGQRPTR